MRVVLGTMGSRSDCTDIFNGITHRPFRTGCQLVFCIYILPFGHGLEGAEACRLQAVDASRCIFSSSCVGISCGVWELLVRGEKVRVLPIRGS